jgi:hypothetical protein
MGDGGYLPTLIRFPCGRRCDNLPRDGFSQANWVAQTEKQARLAAIP